jgi:hypothetical protein
VCVTCNVLSGQGQSGLGGNVCGKVLAVFGRKDLWWGTDLKGRRWAVLVGRNSSSQTVRVSGQYMYLQRLAQLRA